MRLAKLEIKNFKGIKGFTFEPGGTDAAVFGDNATGKTTVYDAFIWLLFGKDSQNKSDFEIKTLQPDGKEIHNLEHTAEVTLELDPGRLIKLKKTYREKWTKKRGSASSEHTGHTTEHFVDDVPVKANEYQQRIASLMDEELFRLLTSPDYFNGQLHWQKRREILLDLCGDVKPADIIAAAPKLEALAAILDQRSIEDHRKIIAAKRKEINRELERIPVRIDEAERSMPEAAGHDSEAIAVEISQLEEKRRELRHQIEAAENGSQTGIRQRIAELQQQEQQIKWAAEKETMEKLQQLRKVETEKRHQQMQLETELIRKKQRADSISGEIPKLEKELAALREEYRQNASQKLEYQAEDTCPTCRQQIPEARKQEAQQRETDYFNEKKAAKLEGIQCRGRDSKEKLEALMQEAASLVVDMENTSAPLTQSETELEEIRQQARQLENQMASVGKTAELEEIRNQIRQLQENQQQRRQLIQDETISLQRALEETGQKIRQLEGQLAAIDSATRTRKRITELEAEEKQLADEYEKLEEELYLTEEYVREKVVLLEGRINEKFQMARFKLFHQQQNGGLAETCETTVNGVPYSSLNNAARINAGLDILNTLSHHYNKTAPVFVDNAEAVTQLLAIDSQTIRLVVSPDHPELTIVNANNRREQIA